MGGLGPGIGGFEYLVIGIVALVVVGPERLPGLLRQLGKMVAKARGMANEFRASFDEMARQSELDDLRKEVEALRQGQTTGMVALGAEADAAFKDIKRELEKPVDSPAATAAMVLDQAEFPEAVMTPLVIEPVPTPKARKPRAKAPAASEAKPKTAAKPKVAAAKPAKARAPHNSKLDL